MNTTGELDDERTGAKAALCRRGGGGRVHRTRSGEPHMAVPMKTGVGGGYLELGCWWVGRGAALAAAAVLLTGNLHPGVGFSAPSSHTLVGGASLK